MRNWTEPQENNDMNSAVNTIIDPDIADMLADLPPTTPEELAAAEREWIDSVLKHKAKMEAAWHRKGYVFSWIDPAPTHMDAGDWNALCWCEGDQPPYTVHHHFPRPEVPTRRILRFSLLGGGQIRSIEVYQAADDERNGGMRQLFPTWRTRWDLQVISQADARLISVGGHFYDGPYYEVNMQAVVLHRHQDIADRAAATLRLIDNKIDNLIALLDPTQGCACCGRPLRDPISKLLGIGPDCAAKYRIEHSRAAAERRQAKRRELLGDAS
jgi:hypothetical protein